MAFLEGAHKWGFPWIPQNGRFVMENLIYMGNVGVPHFRKLTWLEYVIVWLHYCTPQESSHPSSVVTTVLDVLLIIMIENDSTNRG